MVTAKRRDEVERNRGKQPGAPGQNLSMRSDPDETVDHEPSCCVSCGEDLGDAPVEGIERRQVFDTPDPIIITTEHRSVRRRCPCGTLNRGVFPREATAPTSYGPNVRAAALYPTVSISRSSGQPRPCRPCSEQTSPPGSSPPSLERQPEASPASSRRSASGCETPPLSTSMRPPTRSRRTSGGSTWYPTSSTPTCSPAPPEARMPPTKRECSAPSVASWSTTAWPCTSNTTRRLMPFAAVTSSETWPPAVSDGTRAGPTTWQRYSPR